MLDRRIFLWRKENGEWKSTAIKNIEAGDKILGADFENKINITLTVKSAIPMVAPYTQVFLSNGQILSLAKTPSLLTELGWVEPVKGTKIIHARYEPYVMKVRHNLLGYNFIDIMVDKDYPIIASSGYYFRARS